MNDVALFANTALVLAELFEKTNEELYQAIDELSISAEKKIEIKENIKQLLNE